MFIRSNISIDFFKKQSAYINREFQYMRYKKSKRPVFLLVFFHATILLHAKGKELVDYVNTLEGTNSKHELTRGNTYPTTALPFGMHSSTPQTGKNGDGWKYPYFKKTIRGFQQAHQCSSWTTDYCVFSLMPVTGKLVVNEGERAKGFSNDNEISKPNYYKVKLDNGIVTEMSPIERGAHLKFSFPKNRESFNSFVSRGSINRNFNK
ncbi:hypothetical protein BH10BAC3_BH10BAC3_09700 [soil metagenome]